MEEGRISGKGKRKVDGTGRRNFSHDAKYINKIEKYMTLCLKKLKKKSMAFSRLSFAFIDQ